MKIAIVNVWSDLNKGDSAIVIGTIALLKSVAAPGLRVSAHSLFASPDTRYSSGYEHLRESHPDVTVFPALLPYVPIWRQGAPPDQRDPLRLVLRFAYLLRSLTLLACPQAPLFLGADERRSLSDLADADLILSKGGQFLHAGKPGIRGLLSLFQQCYSLMLSSRLKKRVVVFGQSILPPQDSHSRWLLGAVLRAVDRVYLREEMSLQGISNLIGSRAVSVIPDTAYYMQPDHTRRVQSIITELGGYARPLVFVTVRPWFPGDPARKARYLDSIREFVQAVGTRGFRPVLVAHTHGPVPGEDDRPITQSLWASISGRGVECSLILDDLSPGELVALYSTGFALIGTRFHSVILAQCTGVPTIAIAYYGPKAQGMMRSLGLGRYCLEIDSLTSTALLSAFLALEGEHDRLIAETRTHVARGRQVLLDVAHDILGVLRQPCAVHGNHD